MSFEHILLANLLQYPIEIIVGLLFLHINGFFPVAQVLDSASGVFMGFGRLGALFLFLVEVAELQDDLLGLLEIVGFILRIFVVTAE